MAEKFFTTDIHQQTRENDNFRKVLFTTKRSQLVVMSIPAGEDIGEETHEGIDQILTIVEGTGETLLDGKSSPVKAGSVIVVPAGMKRPDKYPRPVSAASNLLATRNVNIGKSVERR